MVAGRRESRGSWPWQHSIDWFKGNCTGKSHISWENLWFPVNFPINQSIETSGVDSREYLWTMLIYRPSVGASCPFSLSFNIEFADHFCLGWNRHRTQPKSVGDQGAGGWNTWKTRKVIRDVLLLRTCYYAYIFRKCSLALLPFARWFVDWENPPFQEPGVNMFHFSQFFFGNFMFCPYLIAVAWSTGEGW